MSSLADFTVQILTVAPGASLGPLDLVDVTDRVSIENMGSVNRAVDRDLLSFKTGDATVGFWNGDGFFDDLFTFFDVTDSWQLRVFRRGQIQFWGAIIGQGSIRFDRREKSAEITAYGLTRHLKDTSAATLTRAIADMTVTTATAGASQITLNSSVGLLTGDVLHVTDHVNKEDVTVKQVTSATVATLEAALGNNYAAASPVVLTTQFYRYKTPDFLVRALFALPAVPVVELKISGSLFRHAALTPVNLGGAMDLTQSVKSGPAERLARRYQLMAGASPKSLYQATPDADWVQEDTTNRPWVDWSPYYAQGTAEPAIALRCAHTPEVDRSSDGFGVGWDPHASGWDFASATKVQYAIYTQEPVTPNTHLSKTTSADGTTWSAIANVAVLPDTIVGAGGAAANAHSAEYDPVRNAVYCSYKGATNGGGNFQFYDITGAAFTDLKQSDDVANTRYYGARYVRDLDLTIVLRQSTGADKGPSFDICAFRGTARIWKRTFPNCRINNEAATASYVYPTQTLRYLNGVLYALVVSDGALQIIYSTDQFVTYVMRKLADSTSSGRYFGARVLSAYCVAGYSGAVPRTHLVGLPFYAGVVPYADFSGKSCADALKEIAVLVNALFWVDDDGQGHFVSRDLFDAGAVLAIDDRVVDQTEDEIWEETVSYVEVTGGGISVVSGDNDFAASGLSVASEFIANEAYAQALADDFSEFYGKRRALVEVTLQDPDGHIYNPLDRVTIGATRYLVYESDHNLVDDEISVKLLEDLA